MNKSLVTALFSCVVLSLCASSLAQSCLSYTFPNNALYSDCSTLSQLNSFLYWNYNQSAGTVDIAFRHSNTDTSTWSAWAINPNDQTMVGAQALVALQNSSGAIYAYTTQLTSYPSMTEAALTFDVTNLSATFANSEMIIFATLHLPASLLSTNMIWQEGPVSGGTPGIHSTTASANLNSVGTVNFQSGQTGGSDGSASSKQRKKNIHGILNAVSWGVLMPIGAMVARYLKVFKSADPTWFYLHVACQSSAYIVGVAGFGTGLKLGSDSPGIEFDTHRTIGIILFCLGTLQVFALLLRPKKDHKYRLYWNIYHHMVGYTTIILSIVNVFEGFDALNGQKNWKKAYIGVIIFLGAAAAILEAFTWFIVIKRKKETQKFTHGAYGVNGANGHNGYGARTQPAV